MGCEGFFDNYVSWAEDDVAHHILSVTIDSNGGGISGHAQGTLIYHPRGGVGGVSEVAIRGTFEGEARQTFSDRISPDGEPFDPSRSDTLGIRLIVSDPPRVRLQAKSWGGTFLSFDAECGDRQLVGAYDGSEYVVRLETFERPG